MLKKILYIIFGITLGFVIFYISWKDSCSTALVNRGNKALKEENYEFFLKFFEIYDKEEVFKVEYTENENTTSIRGYNIYSTKVTTEETEKNEYVSRSGMVLFIEGLNTDVVTLDKSEPSDDTKDEDPATRITFIADNGNTYTSLLSTYGFDTTPIIFFAYFSTEFKTLFKGEATTTPTKISHIKMVDSQDVIFYDCDVNIEFIEHNDIEYWTDLLDAGKAGVTFTSSEYRNNFTFAFPEMRKTFLITGISLLIIIGLGVFIFWPKKSYVPTKTDDDKEKYTFASTEEKEKYALAKVAKGKKEKEDRENRYKNVRTEKSLDEITDEAIEESMDKENTAEAALAEDAKLEESESNDKTIEENKEEN